MKFLADLHTHTISSGHAYSTIQEMAKGASDKGLEMLAMTDHGPKMPGAPHLYHFGNLRALPEEIHGVEILKGVEANILDQDGNIDVPEYFQRNLDIVLGGFHYLCFDPGSVEENTKAAINAMKNSKIDILVHPGNPEFLIDPEKVVKAAKEHNVLIEINNSSLTHGGSRKGSFENCLEFAKEIVKNDWKVSLGSDAHISYDVGNFEKAYGLIENVGLTKDHIINTDIAKIKEFLRTRNRARYLEIK
ncbi:phosphatase [Alkalicella caledoniensis]|uniref:Phosphatase n=1 Tax=Alkalicella caledoniensis TaxID=2731377 RepID=A0A7G9W6T6_ALKCA|nr:phosphatase [Alkalicella caledoniensis]QNO14398.1 phosphatase [Alkalicella caledoniensis]